VRITYDPAKRARTLSERGIDFEDAPLLFADETIDGLDTRHEYGEERVVTVGHLAGRMMIVIWTPRGAARHIISMRKANEKEQKKYRQQFSPN